MEPENGMEPENANPPETAMTPGNKEKKHLFDDIRRVRWLAYFLFGFCAFLFLCDFFVDKSHAHFEWELWAGFYAVFGFVAFTLLVLVAKHIFRPLLKRDEDYYD